MRVRVRVRARVRVRGRGCGTGRTGTSWPSAPDTDCRPHLPRLLRFLPLSPFSSLSVPPLSSLFVHPFVQSRPRHRWRSARAEPFEIKYLRADMTKERLR